MDVYGFIITILTGYRRYTQSQISASDLPHTSHTHLVSTFGRVFSLRAQKRDETVRLLLKLISAPHPVVLIVIICVWSMQYGACEAACWGVPQPYAHAGPGASPHYASELRENGEDFWLEPDSEIKLVRVSEGTFRARFLQRN